MLADCQQKLKSLVIEAGDIDLVGKKKLTIVYFVELIHDISEGFLTYDDCQDITSNQCSVDLTDMNSDHLTVHLIASKERLLEEYQKRYEIEEMPTARVTRPQATDTSSFPLIAPPNTSENFGQRARRLLDERAAPAVLLRGTIMDVAAEPAPQERPPRPNTSTDAVLYHKLKTTLEVIFFLAGVNS